MLKVRLLSQNRWIAERILYIAIRSPNSSSDYAEIRNMASVTCGLSKGSAEAADADNGLGLPTV